MYIDTHCHLYKEYYDDIDKIIKESIDNGVTKFIVNGCDMKSNIEAIELSHKYREVYAAIGFHPTELDDFKEEDFNWLESKINDKKVVAIGEIGLDYHYDNTDKEKEIYVFRKQLDIAKKYNKPIIVHTRDAIGDNYNILKEYNLRGSIHSYSGSVEMAKEFIKLGYMLGIGGVVTFKNAKNIKEVVKNIPLEYIILETDSPYLTPEPFRGTKNNPKYIPIISRCISDIKNIKEVDVSRVSTSNAERLFDFYQE